MMASKDVVVTSKETARSLVNSGNSIFIEAISASLHWGKFVPLKNRNFGWLVDDVCQHDDCMGQICQFSSKSKPPPPAAQEALFLPFSTFFYHVLPVPTMCHLFLYHVLLVPIMCHLFHHVPPFSTMCHLFPQCATFSNNVPPFPSCATFYNNVPPFPSCATCSHNVPSFPNMCPLILPCATFSTHVPPYPTMCPLSHN